MLHQKSRLRAERLEVLMQQGMNAYVQKIRMQKDIERNMQVGAVAVLCSKLGQSSGYFWRKINRVLYQKRESTWINDVSIG